MFIKNHWELRLSHWLNKLYFMTWFPEPAAEMRGFFRVFPSIHQLCVLTRRNPKVSHPKIKTCVQKFETLEIS